MTAALATAALPDLLGTSPADLLPDRERAASTRTEARERADRLRAGIVRYAEMRQDIADAFACRDWAALDYPSWYAYVEGEFGAQLARLGRPERREAISDLRSQGMSTRQIADATGINQSTVVRNLAAGDANASPATVTGSDGKRHPASRPTPKSAKTPGSAGAVTAPPADPGQTEEMSPEVPTPTADPVAAVAAALDQHVPDPDAPKRAWRKDLHERLKPIGNLTLWLKVDAAAQFADEDDVETLRQLALSFTDLHRRVVEARNANVTPLRRIK